MVANVDETNRYAAQTQRNIVPSPRSKLHKWVDVTVTEMWAFLELTIGIGLIVIEDLDKYWSIDELYKLPFFDSVMTRDRFCMILSFLHINNETQHPRDHPAFDPLFEI